MPHAGPVGTAINVTGGKPGTDLFFSRLGEYDAAGNPIREYVWLEAMPLAQIEADGSVLYLHTDHLNTPRAASDASGTLVWRWESDAFGAALPEPDPDGDGQSVTVNLRFPGQYYDQEAGLHYNWHRYYDPETGRYITSDPIGLEGGLNTYAYVNNNPVSFADPFGLLRTGRNDVTRGNHATGNSLGVFVLGISISGQAAVVGGSAGAGIAVGSDGKICIYGDFMGAFGMGIYAGVGGIFSGAIGADSLETGISDFGGIFVDAGKGLAAGTAIEFSEGNPSFGKVFTGIGAGFAAGVRGGKRATYCFNEPDDGC